MDQASTISEMLSVERIDASTYLARNLRGPSPVVFGGQILAQLVDVASECVPGKELQSLHTVFSRGGLPDEPLHIHVTPLQDGRTYAALSIAVRQGDRLCTQSVALLHDPEPDFVRYSSDPPSVAGPEDAPSRPATHPWWELRVVDDVDIQDPDVIGPPELYVWSRFLDVPAGLAASQAMLAFASDGLLIGTAMRPHKGVGQALAHVAISTSVVAQTVSFHEPFDAAQWHLLAHRSPYAGRGRSYGQADVFTEDGRLVASYSQENMIREMPADRAPGVGRRAKY